MADVRVQMQIRTIHVVAVVHKAKTDTRHAVMLLAGVAPDASVAAVLAALQHTGRMSSEVLEDLASLELVVSPLDRRDGLLSSPYPK